MQMCSTLAALVAAIVVFANPAEVEENLATFIEGVKAVRVRTEGGAAAADLTTVHVGSSPAPPRWSRTRGLLPAPSVVRVRLLPAIVADERRRAMPGAVTLDRVVRCI